jgi:hypothetical protein
MIPVPRLHLHELGISGRARLKLIRRFLERSVEGASHFPAKAPTLPSFIFGELSGYLVELGTVTQLSDSLFLFRMFLALEKCSVWI